MTSKATQSASPFIAYSESQTDTMNKNSNTSMGQAQRPLYIHRQLMSPGPASTPTNYSYPFTNIGRKPHPRNGHGRVPAQPEQSWSQASTAPYAEGNVASTVTIVPAPRVIVREQGPASTASLRGGPLVGPRETDTSMLMSADALLGSRSASSQSRRSSSGVSSQGETGSSQGQYTPATSPSSTSSFQFMTQQADVTMIHVGE